jgi:hypothetical protein
MTMDVPFADVITTEADLRTRYRQPSATVQAKKVDRIDEGGRAFIEASPFCLLATADATGRTDVSPRGGPPGFVKVLDDTRLAIPDLSGNNLLDSLTNIVANPHAGLLFVLPGRDETLRLEGSAWLTTDPAVLASWDGELRRPKLAVGVAVHTLYVHCAKSFRRGRVWDPETWSELTGPDVCDLLVAHAGLDVEADEVRRLKEDAYRRDLEAERPAP